MKPDFDQVLHKKQVFKGNLFFDLAFLARKKIFDLFLDVIKPKENEIVLDIGVSPESHGKVINFFEYLYSWPHNVTALSISDCSHLEKKFPGLKFVKYDGEKLPFKDNQFDIVFCNAVIEHVGNYEKQKSFANEVVRVAKKVFVSTPNRWYPIEFHTRLPFTHWLPTIVYRVMWEKMGIAEWSKEENLNLLDKRSFAELFKQYELNFSYVRFFGFVSNLIAWKAP